MYELFYNYLVLNHKANLPGVGTFSVQDIPAKLDFITQSISAPAQQFVFNAENAVTDKQFHFFLSKELNVSEQEAGNQLNAFALKIKESALNGNVDLPGLGSLKKLNEGEVFFIPQKNIESVLPNIHLASSAVANANLVDLYDAGDARIIKQLEQAPPEEKIEGEEKEDYWWVYAIILAILGVGALLYYYV